MAEHKAPVIWSSEALDDLGRLWDHYTEVAGSGTADRILREIAKAIAVIDDFPFAGRSRDVRVLDGRQEAIFSDDGNG